MAAELLGAIANLGWSAAGAILAVLLLRRPLRRWFGAAAAYQAWLIVPAALLATFVPSPPSYELLRAPVVLHLATYTGPALADAGVASTSWVLLAWAAGAAAVGVRFWRGHVAFMRSLGRLTARDGIFYSQYKEGGPASVGLWRPRVIVPADFARRYTVSERTLIIAHERIHVLRGDAIANSLQAMLQCVFWFNPLVHIAASRFRFDQELACDAAVMRAHPHSRRSYADAMLKTQAAFAAATSTIACHWQSSHPLTERIMTLQQTPPRSVRRNFGRLLVAALVCAGSYGALTARADSVPIAGATTYSVAMTFTTPSGSASPRVLAKAGDPFKVAMADKSGKLMASFVATAAGTGSVRLEGTVECGNAAAAHPVLVARLGEAAVVKLQEPGTPGCELAIVVSEVAMKSAAK